MMATKTDLILIIVALVCGTAGFVVLTLLAGVALLWMGGSVWANPAGWAVHFLDVGYGDAVVLQRPDGQTTLIDAGPAESAHRVKAFLKARGIEGIHTVILTHPHDNHCGGLQECVCRATKWRTRRSLLCRGSARRIGRR